MLRGHYAKMTRGLFPKRIIRYAGLTEPPMCTSAYLANVRPDHISSSYWFRSKKCSAYMYPDYMYHRVSQIDIYLYPSAPRSAILSGIACNMRVCGRVQRS